MSFLNEIKEFSSYSEFERFVEYLACRLSENEIEEIEPKEYYHGKSSFGLNGDRWFKESLSGDVWRLIPPDYPFKGFFENVIYPLEGYKERRLI